MPYLLFDELLKCYQPPTWSQCTLYSSPWSSRKYFQFYHCFADYLKIVFVFLFLSSLVSSSSGFSWIPSLASMHRSIVYHYIYLDFRLRLYRSMAGQLLHNISIKFPYGEDQRAHNVKWIEAKPSTVQKLKNRKVNSSTNPKSNGITGYNDGK